MEPDLFGRVERDGGACRLTLSQDGLRQPGLAGVVSGWHDFLEMIPDAADGLRTEYDVPRWQALQALYETRLAGLFSDQKEPTSPAP